MRQIKSVLFWLVQIVVALGLIEIVCYGFLKTSSNPLYRARRILLPNENWGWQTRPNLKTEFENALLFTDQNGFRIESTSESADMQTAELLTLGPSSAFGWGVTAESTYTSQIAKKLHLNYFNASQIGFSTEQGLLLWNLLLKNKLPHLKYVLIAYGINDLDRFRFYNLSFTGDLSYFRANTNHATPAAAPLNSSLVTAFDLLKNEASLKINCEPLRTIKQRLSLSESVQESLKLIKSLKERNVKIVLIGTPYIRMPANSDFRYEDVQKYYQATESAAADGNCTEALSLLKSAKALEPWRVERDVATLAEMQKQLSQDEGVLYVDTYAAFHNLQVQKEYFADPVHPSPKGHALITELVLEKLK